MEGHCAPPVPVRLSNDGCALVILDQTALPERETELSLTTLAEIEEAIRSLRVRGAPLIGITAALGVAMLARRRHLREEGIDPSALSAAVRGWCERLERARPTAVNLSWALDRMFRVADQAGPAPALIDALETEALAILAEDRGMCRRIGLHALDLLTGATRADAGLTLFTHCNAGALATGGIGTALAPIYLSVETGIPTRVFVDETRPLLQGSRLTTWELERANVDVTLITDGMAGSLLAGGEVDAVLVGADRIAANGDVANKIGTYGLAVLARYHEVPLYALAPTSTVDLATTSGADIPIERRDADEVRRGFGQLTAPATVPVWSPAFDVTPADLVSAIVTEAGVLRPPYPAALKAAVEEAGRMSSTWGAAQNRPIPK